jgi:hypothetical protein
MSSLSFKLFDDIPGEDPWQDDGLCDCGDDRTVRAEIDGGDLLISCSTCGKNLLHEHELVFMEPTEVDLKCIQDHNHHWDTLGCECDFYWELKVRSPKE